MLDLPSGTVSFLFTDIEGSTPLWDIMPDAMNRSLAQHNALLREAIAACGGHVFKVIGDAFQAAFATSEQAVRAAVAGQRALQNQPTESWGRTGPLRVRMGIHVGPAEWRGDDYGVAHTLNRVARITSVGHGRQIVVSAAVAELVRDAHCDFSLRDLGQHRLKGLNQAEHLYQVVAPDLPADFAPLRTLNARPNNLPTGPTPLVGREQAAAAVRALLLRADVRLVTLIGPGGIGKTRLSVEVAADLLEQFVDGAYFVALASITDAAVVPAMIAQALDISAQGDKPLMQSLKEYLRNKQQLLVLDNFEQVLDAAPVVADLLAAAPNVRALVSSRAALRLYGEKEFPVPALALPDLRLLPAPEQLGQYEAVRLFITRAQDVKPGFIITNENAPAVAEICHRLDGLPLAIELAAARVRMLPPQALLARLSSRLKLLTSGARNLPARQQTLRGAIDWSYDLLDHSEQVLFRRLGVFVGGCTLEAAEAICNADGDLVVDVFDVLESLVGKSLVRQVETASGEVRFVMLQTIWEYMVERLAESGEADTIAGYHTRFFLALAEAATPELRGRQQLAWLERVESDLDNLRAALRRVTESRDTETALRLSATLSWFWLLHGNLSEGCAWLEGAVALPGAAAHPESFARALSGLGHLSVLHGRLSAARGYAEQSKDLFLATGDTNGLAFALQTLGMISQFQGDLAGASRLLQECLTVYREAGNLWGTAQAHGLLGMVDINQGDYARSRSHYEESLTRFRQVGDTWFTAVILNHLGDLERTEGNNEQAARLYGESLALFRKSGSKRDVAALHHNLAYIAHHQGDSARAAQLFAESLSQHREVGNQEGMTECLAGFAILAAARGRFEAAARLFGAVEALREAIGALAWPGRKTEYERNTSLVRTQLDPQTFAAAQAEGRAMLLEQAAKYAVGTIFPHV